MPHGEPTSLRKLRITDDLWERFGQAVTKADPEADRSKVLRNLIRWYVGDLDQPPRP